MPAPVRCTCGSPARRRAIRAFTGSRHRRAISCSRPASISSRWPNSSASTASPSCRSTASTGRWARLDATRSPRASATPASAATIRSGRWTPMTARSRYSCRCSRPLPRFARQCRTAGGPRSQTPHPRLAGRIALITGASRGIGAAVAERFAREGAHVVLAARTTGGLEEVDDRVRAAGGIATLVPIDLREFIKIDELAAALYQRYGRLDILVGNAAEFGIFSPLGHIDPKLWDEVVY